MSDIYDEIARRLFGGTDYPPSTLLGEYLPTAGHVPLAYFQGKIAGAFRAEFAQRTCATCQHWTPVLHYVSPDDVRDTGERNCRAPETPYREFADQAVVTPPTFSCSLWAPKLNVSDHIPATVK